MMATLRKLLCYLAEAEVAQATLLHFWAAYPTPQRVTSIVQSRHTLTLAKWQLGRHPSTAHQHDRPLPIILCKL